MNQQTFAITKFSDLANPTRFLALAERLLPWMAGLCCLLFAAGLIVPLRRRWMRNVRNVLAVIAGIALYYHESDFPPISRAISR